MIMNPMREIRIEKVVLNVGCGSDRDKLKRAEKLLKEITDQKPLVTKTHKRTTFGMARRKSIGVKVTLRKQKAKTLLRDALKVVDNKLKASQINGDNFSFGIKEHIDLPGVKYDPDIGILGMDVCVTLERPGFRVKRRTIQRSKVGKAHKITKEEAMKWLKDEFRIEF